MVSINLELVLYVVNFTQEPFVNIPSDRVREALKAALGMLSTLTRFPVMCRLQFHFKFEIFGSHFGIITQIKETTQFSYTASAGRYVHQSLYSLFDFQP